MQANTFFLRPRISHRAPAGISPATAGPESKSPARLAAEAAFSISSPSSEGPAPTVTVRRSKVLEPVSPGEGADLAVAAEAAVEAGTSAESGKGPRVFRLPQPSQEPIDPAPAGPSTDEGRASSASQQVAHQRKKKRAAADQRPGPVVHIFGAPAVAAAHPGAELTHQQLVALATLLASVQPILDDIERAQALRF